jgi:Zn ribbon nucleic-acid-binding protein
MGDHVCKNCEGGDLMFTIEDDDEPVWHCLDCGFAFAYEGEA